MANEIKIQMLREDSGKTLVVDLERDGVVLNADIALTEVGSSTFYQGDMPSVAAGYITFAVKEGGSHLDLIDSLYWDGDQLYRSKEEAELALNSIPEGGSVTEGNGQRVIKDSAGATLVTLTISDNGDGTRTFSRS